MTTSPATSITQVRSLFASGKHSDAAQACERAVAEWPENMELLNLYGELLMQLSRPAEAESCFRGVLAHSPDRADVLNRLAAVLLLQGRSAEAEQSCQQALSLAPDIAEIHANLGNIHATRGDVDAAEKSFRRAVEIAPGFLGAQLNLGNLYKAQGKYAEAEDCYLKVLQGNPRFIDMYIGLAECCLGRGELAHALQYYDAALSKNPAFLQAHLNKAAACAQLDRNDDALASLDTVLRLDPEHAEALLNRGLVLKRLGRFDQAADSLSKALGIRPENTDIQLSLGLLKLLLGHYRDGWRLYAARKSVREKGFEQYGPLPADLSGRHVLLLKDQGLGDEIFFLRFASELKARGARITYQADQKISSILGRVDFLDRVLLEGEPVEFTDYIVSVGDLPCLLGFDEHEAVPVPLTLHVDGDRIPVMRDLLEQAGPPPWVGITWWAGTHNPEDTLSDRLAYREVPLQKLAQVVSDTAGTVVVLQRNPNPEELAMLTGSIRQPVFDASALNDELEDMLALLGLLQDYIGVDNTNMHLATGIGKACRILVPHPPEWRMQASGVQSPWFPGFRLYRQEAGGDWGEAMDTLHADLLEMHGTQH